MDQSQHRIPKGAGLRNTSRPITELLTNSSRKKRGKAACRQTSKEFDTTSKKQGLHLRCTVTTKALSLNAVTSERLERHIILLYIFLLQSVLFSSAPSPSPSAACTPPGSSTTPSSPVYCAHQWPSSILPRWAASSTGPPRTWTTWTSTSPWSSGCGCLPSYR